MTDYKPLSTLRENADYKATERRERNPGAKPYISRKLRDKRQRKRLHYRSPLGGGKRYPISRRLP